MSESTERVFEAYGDPLINTTTFKYLGRVMKAGDYEWSAVVSNLQRASKSWRQLSRILIREGADPKVSGDFLRR